MPDPQADVVYSRRGRIARLTLNRAAKLNALTRTTYRDFHAVLDEFDSDSEARVAILSGAGRAFCAGADLVAEGQRGAAEPTPLWSQRDELALLGRLCLRLWDSPKPMVGQVHGHCIAGGVMIAASCDITIVADDAVIGWPRLPVGGGYIGRLAAWYVGPKRAKEMSFMAGSEIDGRTAAAWGFANRSVPAADLARTVESMATHMAKMPGSLLELKKASINSLFNQAGYRDSVLAGADWDVMAHQDPGIGVVRDWIREAGFRAAIERFNDEGL